MALSILYVCGEDKATTKQRLLALKDLGVNFDVIYYSLLSTKISFITRVVRAGLLRAGFYPERNNENEQVVQASKKKRYDILFIEKGLSIRPGTLKKVKKNQPHIKIVSYSLDDIKVRTSNSWYYKKSLHLYDFLFTMNKWNVEELKAKGVKNVFHFNNAFSTHVHHPVMVTEQERENYGADVTFVGTYEKQRVGLIRYLADHDIIVKIWGWSRTAESSKMVHPKIILINRHVYDDEYAKVICSSKINLCFLRKVNRDTQTTRTFEIPAMGGFMLAERTADHLKLFEEGKEASFFDSKEELLEMVRYYLKHDEERKAVAAKGRIRSLNSKYSYQDQLIFIISTVMGNEAFGNN